MRHLAIRLASISALALTGAAVPPTSAPATAAPLASPAARDFGANLERFDYPWPVQTMTVDIIGEPARMAFMDIAADRPNGRTVVLLHGKNFCGATWEGSARTLINAGFRVIIPDQIGFCKSSKPRSAQYSLELMAALTNKLLITRGVGRASIVGHSMGGMLAMRYAIMFPAAVDKLVLVNPIGLKDRSEEGVGYTDVDTLWATEKRTNYASIKAYQQNNYYHDTWKPSYDRWVWMLAGMYTGSGRDAVALAQAKTSEMIRTQPVAHELERIVTPTTMIIGTLDRTAFGRQQAPPSLQKFLTAIPVNAPAAVRRMRNAVLVKLDGLGHAPQIEAPARFDAAMMDALRPARR